MIFSYMQKRNEYQNKPYIKRVFIALDQLLNALLGGNPDMTISGRIGWRLVQKKATQPEIWLCRFLRVFESEHCIKSIEIDEIRSKAMPRDVDFYEDDLVAHFSDEDNHYLYDDSEDGLLLSSNDSTTLKERAYTVKMNDGSLLLVEFGDTLVFNKETKQISVRKEK